MYHHDRIMGCFLKLILLCTTGGIACPVWGQNASGGSSAKSKVKSKSPSGSSVRVLDNRVLDLQRSLYKDAIEIARGYEDLGEYERAKWMYEVLLKLDPKLPGVKEKIDQLQEKVLEATEFEVEVDVARGWTPPLAIVTKDKPARIEVEGDYIFEGSWRLTADGFRGDDSGHDYNPQWPLGCLIGVIVAADTGKPGKPFDIKSHKEFTPQQTGILQLKMNLPAGHKASGKLRVKLSGMARPKA
ncbi:MAG: hypothetical protein KatS3mg113_0769 [Planctomycetaceae bacterium]|nr:MAG: hypothetical protein KatS3mg113_0769 [Planctomycetaceae bacterium]